MDIQLVNTTKLYSVIGKFFTDKDNLLLELIQNSLRAKAGNIHIQAPYSGIHPFGTDCQTDHLLSITDDGQGITEIVALLGIAISDWDKDIESQEPAGMGFLQLLALSTRIRITSTFGQLVLDSQRFLQDHTYRLEVINSAFIPNPAYVGTEILAEMQTSGCSYLKYDKNWYKGYGDYVNLTINGEVITPQTIGQMYVEAQEKGHLVKQVEFKGNQLLLEVGYSNNIVSSCATVINWYGQYIPVQLCNHGLLDSYLIRFYYEVRQGTPITPRYPDRTCLNADSKFDELKAFAARQVIIMLVDYFDNIALYTQFRGWENHRLLELLYLHGTHSQVEWLDWVPVDKEPFTSKGLRETTIIRKAELINEGYIFLAGSTIIPNNYYLGCDYNQIKCIHVEEWVASFIRETGLKEVIGIKPTTEPQQMINLTPLMLTLTFSDESTRICMLPDAVISNQFGEVFIYAPSEGKIQEVFDEYWEDVADHSGDNDIHDQETDLRDRLAEEMADFFGVLSQSRFDFLPHFYQLKSLTFEHGNLACKYEDGTTKQYILRRDS